MSSIPSLLDIQAMPSRTFRVQKLKEYTCPICRRTYEKRNSLNRHIKNKHVTKLQCFFCEKTFTADRISRREAHMLKAHNYPVPERSLQVPLDASMDVDGSNLNFKRGAQSSRTVDHVTPVFAPSPVDLASLFPVEEPDISGIPLVHLPGSPLPSGYLTPLQDERSPPVPQTSETEVRDLLSPFSRLEGQSCLDVGSLPPTMETPYPVLSTLSESEQHCLTSWEASRRPLPQSYDTPQMADAPAVSDTETQAAVVSIAPMVEIGTSTVCPSVPFPSDSLESPVAGQEFPAVDLWAGPVVEPEPVAPTQDPTDPQFLFYGAPSQWDNSLMAGVSNGYRVEFSARPCIQVTMTEWLTLPDGREYSLVSTWLAESSSQWGLFWP